MSGIPKNLQRGSSSRNRGLAEFHETMGHLRVRRELERLSRLRRPRILEIGSGEGRLLLDLMTALPHAEIVGINKESWPAMQGQRSLLAAARYYRLATPSTLACLELPSVQFCSAESLPFESASVDAVFSQAALHYVEDKAKALSEIWRVLRPTGVALLHLDSKPSVGPDFFQGITPRLIIYNGQRRLSCSSFFSSLRKRGFPIRMWTSHELLAARVFLQMRRNSALSLDLGLVFDKLSSFRLERLDAWQNGAEQLYGYRSVYRIA